MRKVKNWLSSYLYYTEKQESPEAFHKWCGISLLAASLERNTWMETGYYKIFPNHYIIIIGASAQVRKGGAINLVEDMYRIAFPEGTLFAQKITPSALIVFMRDSFKTKNMSGGYIIAEELSVFLGNAIQDATLVQILTKLYNCPEVLDYDTIKRGRDVAHKAFCNLLGGTTPEWIKDSFPPHAIGGGFAGRIVFVYQSKTDRKFAFPELDEGRRQEREKLVLDLREINKIKGIFTMTPKAKQWYKDWYEDVFDPDKATSDLRGYYGRKHTHVLKLSMVLSVARESTLIVREEDMFTAIKILSDVEKLMPETLRLIQSTQVGQNQQKILTYIRSGKNRVLARSALINKMSYIMTAREVDDLLNTLMQGNRIETYVEDSKTFYKMK